MARKLFCEISPTTYRISVWKCRMLRRIQDFCSGKRFAHQKDSSPLPVKINSHKSLIRRKLGNTDLKLQENKAVNLGIAAPKVNGILIHPGEAFSFWHLVGSVSASKGYLEGLTISKHGMTMPGIGGGLCQFTNLIHWMVLHSDLVITERHHHEDVDIFPDYGRQVPFGTGTSIVYNYLDYRFINPTDRTYQLLVWVTDEYLCGELRADKPQTHKAHIKGIDEYFSREGDKVFRNGKVQRTWINRETGMVESEEILQTNHVEVLYDTSELTIREAR